MKLYETALKRGDSITLLLSYTKTSLELSRQKYSSKPNGVVATARPASLW